VSGHLYRDGTLVPLAPKAFSVLSHLVANGGRLLPKQELLDTAWPGVFVTDAVLKVTIRDIRKALGDSPTSPTFIETAHRRGYRFIAPLTMADAAPAAGVAPALPAGASDVRYARSGAMNIAYQVIGSGPIDLVFVMGWVSHLEYFWREPSFAKFLTRLAGMGRLIVFDKRGTGLSDPVPVSQLPTLDERLDDVRAVMDAAGSERAVLVGVSEGGPLCTLFAATYPEKTRAVVMIGSYARRLIDEDYPWGRSLDAHEEFCRQLLERWGGPVGLEERAPSMANDPAFRDWWASYLRMGASPGAAVALTRMNAQIDVRDVLPAVRVPTLVLHRTGDKCLKVEEGRYLAARIPGALFVEFPGDDHLPFVGNQDELIDAMSRFLDTVRIAPSPDTVLATVLTVLTDASGADRAHLERVFVQEIAMWRGRRVAPGSPSLVAAFDGPGRAVRCARAVTTVASRSAIAVRAGVHIGECDPAAHDGPVFEASRSVAGGAQPGEVLVSRTVVDLVHGSGLQFTPRAGSVLALA
jgi:pimeloyl-ACP methyl ester carboxylesterase/DNA-binding winged helix-turn-helix (wHTH) protein